MGRSVPGNLKPMGFQKLAVSSTAVALTVPSSGGLRARFAVFICESDACRWRDDGVSPTASDGMLFPNGSDWTYDGKLDQIRFIRVTTDAQVDVAYYV